MKGTDQKRIGEAAERRLRKELDIPGAQFLPPLDVHHDIHWVLGEYDFAIECKTLKDRYTNNRRGAVKFRAKQILEMTLLWRSGSSVKPILIVELRPYNMANRTWMVVPWKLVFEKWNRSKKDQMPLYFWWVIRNGYNLHCWLELAKRGLLTKDGGALL